MVVLNRIYTKTGDAGETALANGERVAKHSKRVGAYGTVDELNAQLGVARLHTQGDDTHSTMGEAIAHLNALWHRGSVQRERDAAGVWRFRAV